MDEPKHKNCIAERDWLRLQYGRLLDEFRIVAIDLHVNKHYAVSGVRWEECEDCEDIRNLLPEYAPALSSSKHAAVERGIAAAEKVEEMWERN